MLNLESYGGITDITYKGKSYQTASLQVNHQDYPEGVTRFIITCWAIPHIKKEEEVPWEETYEWI